MADSDFIKAIQDNLRKQQSQDELATEKKLHDAGVLKTDGPAKWQALQDYVKQAAAEVNKGFPQPVLAYSKELTQTSFTIHNEIANRVVTVSFANTNAVIAYHGQSASGSFMPTVGATELEYRWQSNTSMRAMDAMATPGAKITINKIGDLLIASIASNS